MNLKEFLLSLDDTFEDNEYLDLYVDLIENNRYTKKEKYRTQVHHIVPRCWFKLNSKEVDNTPTNKINLLFKDHIIAHCYLVLASKENRFKYFNRLALDKMLHARFHLDEIEDNKKLDIVQLAYENSRLTCYLNNPMFIESSKIKHDNTCKTDEFRQHVSSGLKKYKEEFGLSEEHRKKLSIASKRTYYSKYKSGGLSPFGVPFSTRSIKCYCILLNTGEKHVFDSYKDAGIWWFENYHPFGYKYVQPTLQRKIIDMCDGKDVYWGTGKNGGGKNKIKIDYIKWYRLEESCAEAIESI